MKHSFLIITALVFCFANIANAESKKSKGKNVYHNSVYYGDYQNDKKKKGYYAGYGIEASKLNEDNWGGGFVLELGSTTTETAGVLPSLFLVETDKGYGHDYFNIVMGIPFSLNVHNKSGYKVTGKENLLHIGIEPHNFELVANSEGEDGLPQEFRDYASYNPSGSIGYLIQTSNCNILAVMRTGYEFNTRGSGPLAGASTYANCDSIDATGEYTRVFKTEGGNRETITIDTNIAIFNSLKRKDAAIGLRVKYDEDKTPENKATKSLSAVISARARF